MSTHEVVSADGTTIAYRERGEGPGLVLVHGAMQSARSFTQLAAALSSSFRVYVPDRRGRGRSGPFGPAYGLDREAEDLDALLRRSGARFVFGLSSGALIALHAARSLSGIEKVAAYEPPLTVDGADPATWVPRYEREVDRGSLAAAMATALQGAGDVELLTYLPRFLLVPLLGLAIRAGRPQAVARELKDFFDSADHVHARRAREAERPAALDAPFEQDPRAPHARGAWGREAPGEVRRTQNWIGGSRPGNPAYVPPPPHALGEVLGAFEKYLHSDDTLPPLVRAGLLHVQFETIHPYLDGNGRIGRLLVTLLLEHWKLLTKPILYLSLFFKRHRSDYYARLNAVRVEGDWEGWLDFFLDGVATIADDAVASARELFALVAADRARVLAHEGMSIATLRLFELLPRHPVVTVASAIKLVETTKPTAGRAIELLVNAGVLAETTGRKRDRSFGYQGYLDRLRVGTEIEGTGRGGRATREGP